MNSNEVEQHLEMGKKLLAAGQLAEALQHYHSAVGKNEVYASRLFIFACSAICYVTKSFIKEFKCRDLNPLAWRSITLSMES